jgi:hypothetical protein
MSTAVLDPAQFDLPPMEPVAPVEAPVKRGPGRPRKNPADKAPRPAPAAGSRPRPASLEHRLTASITTMGTMVGMVHMPDGLVIVSGAPQLSAALARLAAENPAVKQGLERMLTAGAWSAVLAAAVPIVAGLALNHGMLPGEFASVLKGAPPTDA